MGLQQEECDYLRMIAVQHEQCLEEAQLENETAGEAPGGKREPSSLHVAHLPLIVSPAPLSG